tara:strand:+ start:2293 stop:4986 length:2694 start_codon:yes stop_codon:yes gene_type:complete
MALSVSDYKEIIRLTKEIKEEERELARLKAEGQKINKERLETLKAELEVKRKGKEEAESEYKTTEKLYKTATNLSKGIVGNSDELLKRKRRIAEYDKSSNDLQLMASDALKKSSEFEETILRTKSKSNMLSFDSKSMIQEINEQLEIINEQYDEASDEQKEILDNTKADLKLTEKKVRAMGEVADKAKGLKAAQDKIKELAGGYVDKLEAGLEMIKSMGKAIMENPRMAFAALGATIGKSISYGIARIKDMQQDLGAARSQAIELRREFNDMNLEFGARQIGFDLFGLALGADAGKLAGSLSNEMGTLQSVTEETVNQMMLFEKGLMVSGDTSAKLLQNFMKIRGESMETALKSMETVGALAIANEIPVNVLMKEIADNTETFAEFSIQGSNNIEMAAAQAKRLGVNLATTAKIANSLLDFESSIEREMRASLLIGRQLNYNRARQLALEGNIAGAAADVVSQLGGQAGFARLNVIQRRALAESIGVSVEELSRLASGRPIQLKSADEESRDKLRESTDALTNMMDNFLQKFGTGIGAIFGSGLGTELLGQYIGFRGVGSIMRQIGMSLGLVTKPIVDATTGRRAGGIFGDIFNFFKRGQDDIIPGAERRLDLRRGFGSKGEAKLLEALNKLNITMDKSGRLRAPVGGIQIGNKFYKGGSLLPSPDKIMDAFDKSGRSLGKDVGRALDKTKVTGRGPRIDIPPKTFTDIGKKFGDGLSKFIKNNGSKMFKSLSLIGAGFEVFQTQKEVKALGGMSNREAQRTVADSITGFGGALVGARLGAMGGAALGAMFGPAAPVMVPLLTIAGALGGGYFGYQGGEALGGAAFDMISPEQKQIDELKDTNDNIDKGLQSNATNIGAVAEKLAELATEVSLLKQANEQHLTNVVTAVNNLNPQRA